MSPSCESPSTTTRTSRCSSPSRSTAALRRPTAKYLAKGRQVAVVGRLQIDEWERDGVKRERPKIVGRVEFLGSPSRTDDDAIADEALAAAAEVRGTADGDIPF